MNSIRLTKEQNYYVSSFDISELHIDISFIIINYSLAKEIDNCIKSLLETINKNNEINYEIIIIDNNSPDKYLSDVEKKYKSDLIKFYYLDQNLGFGKGCNYGFSKASGKYICFLNPDTIIKEDIFLAIVNLFKEDNTIGIIGPRQMVKAPFFDFSAGMSPNIFFELCNLFGVGIFVEGFFMFYWTKLFNRKKFEVKWILGAAIFISAELFESVYGFDEDYFMFFEELDLCRKVSAKGFKIIYYPSLNLHHIGSVSGKKDYRLYTIRTYSSKSIFISKHYRHLMKYIMKIFLYIQIFPQLVIWIILFPINKEKSKQKLKAFLFLLKNRMKYEHRN